MSSTMEMWDMVAVPDYVPVNRRSPVRCERCGHIIKPLPSCNGVVKRFCSERCRKRAERARWKARWKTKGVNKYIGAKSGGGR